MINSETIRDPESDKTVRYTDNGLKEGDLPGFDPTGMTHDEILMRIQEMAGDDNANS